MTALLLDIEGTTAPISFVHEVLFPYAKQKLASFFESSKIGSDLFQKIDLEFAQDKAKFSELSNFKTLSFEDQSSIIPYLEFLISQDRKFGPLKEIQGQIWRLGYESGEIKSQIFEDVPLFLAKAKEKNIACYVYSSGSVEAQRNIYQYSPYGDLRSYFSGYFDTAVGGKKESLSYLNIAKTISSEPNNLVFFTDILEEAEASKKAGLESILLDRPGNLPQNKHDFRVLKNLLSFF